MTDAQDSEYNTEQLLVMIEAFEEYAKNIRNNFDDKFYDKDYYFLLHSICCAYWKGNPLSVKQGIKSMDFESDESARVRIKFCESEGLIIKESHSRDRRVSVLLPTEKLEALVRKSASKGADLMRNAVEALSHAGKMPKI